MFGAAAALYVGHVPTLLTLIFLLGVLATIFGPLKYSLMPQHLRQSELVGGNALVDAGTFIAILIGTISGGLLSAHSDAAKAAARRRASHVLAAVAMVVVAVGTYLCSRSIPRAEATDPTLQDQLQSLHRDLVDVIRFAAQTRAIFLSLLGISWFWLVGALILAQLPAYAQRRARRRQDGVHAAARRVFDRHRAGLAGLRAAVRPQGGNRPRAAGIHRHDGVPARSVLRASGRARRRRAALLSWTAVPGRAAAGTWRWTAR